jgi:hypothetical protein
MRRVRGTTVSMERQKWVPFVLLTDICCCKHCNKYWKLRSGSTAMRHMFCCTTYCNRWSRFDALDVRLYIGPRLDLRVLQGVTIIGGMLSVWRLVWLSSSKVVNNTRGFRERRKRVQLTFCKDPFVVLRQDWRWGTWLLFCLVKFNHNWLLN